MVRHTIDKNLFGGLVVICEPTKTQGIASYGNVQDCVGIGRLTAQICRSRLILTPFLPGP
jgi:hypothetical protein